MTSPILSLLLACTPDEQGARSPLEAGPTDPDAPPQCLPGGIGVVDFRAEEIPNQPLGRDLVVTLDGDAGVAVTCALDETPANWRQLVPLQSRWHYLDTGEDPGADWAQRAYDDSDWPQAPAPFGVASPLVTEIALGATEPPPITWFRTDFTVDDPSAVEELQFAVRRDDGVVVHINGTEVLRDNVPILDPALGNEEETLYRFTLANEPGLLTAGENTLAVALHQQDGSTDAGFDLRLSARVRGGDEAPEIHLVESPDPATEHRMALYGLLAESTYTCTAHVQMCGPEPVSVEVATGAVGSPIPPLAAPPDLHIPSWGAYTLFNHQRPCADDHHNRLIVVDPEGRARWVYEIGMASESTIDIEAALVDRDSFVWSGGQQLAGAPQIVGLDGELRYFSTYEGVEEDVYHHDVERDPDGRLLGLTMSNVNGGTHTWSGWQLVEHDPSTGDVTWRWDSGDAFHRGELEPAPIGEYDPWHANAFTSVDDADGQGVYVALLYTNEIVRVDRTTGSITAHIGPGRDYQLVDHEGQHLPDSEWFDGLHGLNLYGDRLYLYDNGWTREQSRAVALRLDSATRRAELAWSWTEFGWFEKHWGDVDELPNGSVLIAMAHAYCHDVPRYHPGALVEVDPRSDDVLWRLDFLDSDDSTYRAERIDGCALFANSRYCPDVAERVAQLRPR